MKLHEITPDDAYASLVRSMHRRELRRLAKERRRTARKLFALPALVGIGILAWAVFSLDNPNLQALKICAGLVLVVPFLATFDLLGER